MSPRASRALATTLALLTLAITVVAMVLLVPDSAVQGSGPYGVTIVLLAVTFSIVGWLIASRRSENRIGWMLDLASLSGDIADVVDTTLHPSRIGVWLREPAPNVSRPTTP